MSNGRSHRRRASRFGDSQTVRPAGSGGASCPYCGSHPLRYTDSHEKFAQAVALFGMKVGPIDPFVTVLVYWVCEWCGEGGGLIEPGTAV